MLRDNQKFVVALVILVINMVILVGECFAADFTVRLVVNPSKTDIYLGSEPVALTARAKGKNLTFDWKLLGPGKLDGEGSSVFYILPEEIKGESEQALITVTVKDETGQEITESVTLNIIPKETTRAAAPAAAPKAEPKVEGKGMSKGTMIALGVGAVAAIGGGVALASGGGDDGGGNGGGGSGLFTGRYTKTNTGSDATYTRILDIVESGGSVTGTYQVTVDFNISGTTTYCCTVTTPTVSVTGTVQGNTGTLSWGPVSGTCQCARDQFWVDELGGTFNVTSLNDGRTLRLDGPWGDDLNRE